MRQVCGLDVHKDSVFVCILNENGIVFQEKYGVTEVCMESTYSYTRLGRIEGLSADELKEMFKGNVMIVIQLSLK